MNLDAYTIRKIAPRLFFAVIGVNLSIYLCVAGIDLATVAGHGVGQLIRGPFDAAGGFDVHVDEGAGNITAPIVVLTVLVAGIVTFKGAVLSTIFALLLPVFVLILSILITLAIRQALLVLLTLVSPVAIVLAVLPGTEKYFKQWWDLFLKTLIVYPLIAALFAVSDVLTATSIDLSNEGSNITGAENLVTAILFAFMPLVLIPFVFRFAGGVLGGFMNATSGVRGMANRWAGSRLQQNAQKGFHDIRSSNLFTNARTKDEEFEYTDAEGNKVKGIRKKQVGFRGAVNKNAARLANMDQMKFSRPLSSIDQGVQRAIAKRAMEVNESEEGKMLAGFDDELWAIIHSDGSKAGMEKALIERAGPRYDHMEKGITPQEAKNRRNNLNNSVSMMQDYMKVGGGTAGRAGATVGLHGVSTSYDTQFYKKNQDGSLSNQVWKQGDAEELKSDKIAKTSERQMQESILIASGGMKGLGNWITAESIKGAKAAGRYDMAASASAVVMYQEALRGGDSKAIQGADKYYKKMMKERVTPAQMLQGHPRAAKEMAAIWGEELDMLSGAMNSPKAKSNPEEMAKAQEAFIRGLGDVAGIQDALSAAGPEAKDYFDKGVLSKEYEGWTTKLVQDFERDPKDPEKLLRDGTGKAVARKDKEGKPVMVPKQVWAKQSVGTFIEEHRDNDIFNLRRREYSRRSGAAEAAAGYQGAEAGRHMEQPPATGGL